MDFLVTADARRVTGLEFLDSLGISSAKARAEADAKREALCIRLIEVGHDMYGWPPAMVEHCKAIMADRAKGTRANGQ